MHIAHDAVPMAGEPGKGADVKVEPPLNCKGPSMAAVDVRSLPVLVQTASSKIL